MDPIFTSKRRLPAVQTDFTKCIICQLESGNHDLNYLTKNVIETSKNALRIRKMKCMIGCCPKLRTLMCFWRRNHCVTETVEADTLIRKN